MQEYWGGSKMTFKEGDRIRSQSKLLPDANDGRETASSNGRHRWPFLTSA